MSTIEEWKAMRADNVGSSEVAALFGCSPWLTEFHLWNVKANKVPHPEVDSSVIKAGTHLESGLAKWAAEKWKWNLVKGEYTKHATIKGMACSPDYIDTEDGCPVEFKFSEFGEGWVFDGEEVTDAPLHYLLQVQQQIACMGKPHGWLVVYKGGDIRRMLVPRSDAIIEQIEQRIKDFWTSVNSKAAPDPDFKRDGDVIDELRKPILGEYTDITGDQRATELLATMEKAKAILKTAENEYDEAKTELVTKLGSFETVRCGDWLIKSVMVKDNPGTLVTQEMVGTRVSPRKGHIRISTKKTTKENQ